MSKRKIIIEKNIKVNDIRHEWDPLGHGILYFDGVKLTEENITEFDMEVVHDSIIVDVFLVKGIIVEGQEIYVAHYKVMEPFTGLFTDKPHVDWIPAMDDEIHRILEDFKKMEIEYFTKKVFSLGSSNPFKSLLQG